MGSDVPAEIQAVLAGAAPTNEDRLIAADIVRSGGGWLNEINFPEWAVTGVLLTCTRSASGSEDCYFTVAFEYFSPDTGPEDNGTRFGSVRMRWPSGRAVQETLTPHAVGIIGGQLLVEAFDSVGSKVYEPHLSVDLDDKRFSCVRVGESWRWT